MNANDDLLSSARLARVLDKLEVDAPPRPSLASLAEIYSAWCRSVPFDNVRKLIHMAASDPATLPGDTAADFFDAWLRWGSGGTCWAGNGALCVLLRTLGFDAERGVGTMLVVPDLPPNHGTVVVKVEGGRYLVDASVLFAEPLALAIETESSIDHPAWGVRCDTREQKWHIRWRPLHRTDGMDCRLDHFAASASDFSELHEATRGWSPFNYAVNARLNAGGGVVGLAFGHRVGIDANGVATRTAVEDHESRRVLVEEIGIHPELIERLPADRPTPPIPTSRSAAR